MYIVIGKLLLWFSFAFFQLIDTMITQAQPEFISYYCNDASNYTTNSTYQRNLDTTLSILPDTNSGFGFYNLSTGQGNDRVNSIGLCRGDVRPNVCRSCINDSIIKLREICPNQKEAIGYYDYYKEGFGKALRPLLNQLRSDAAVGGPLLKFATGNTQGPDLETIYGLVQCTPDLKEMECSACLEDAINQFVNSYGGKVGGQTLLPMCKFRYEIYQFYNGSTLGISPPPSFLQASPPIPFHHHKVQVLLQGSGMRDRD